MKLTAIKKACMRRREFGIYTQPNGRQWIGHCGAIYPVDGVTLTEDSIPAVFDLNEKQRKKLVIASRLLEGTYGDARIDIHPMPDSEIICEVGDAAIVYQGGCYRPIFTEQGVMLLDAEDLKPAEGKTGYLEFYVRYNARGSALIACYGDMLVSAIVAPLPQEDAAAILGAVGRFASRDVLQTRLLDDDEYEGSAVGWDEIVRLFEQGETKTDQTEEGEPGGSEPKPDGDGDGDGAEDEPAAPGD